MNIMVMAAKLLDQYALGFKLKPVSLREFLFIQETPCDVWGGTDGLYKVLLKKRSFINPAILKNLITQGHTQVFIPYEDRFALYQIQEEELRKLTRGLSIGNPLENAKKQINLLTINLRHLYENPTNDQVLSLQYQSVRSLSHFLYKNTEIHEPLFREFIKQKHHYIYAQPLLASLFLSGVLKMARLYSEKEVESLFVTSYFKDIGMSAIPTVKYDQEDLSTDDKHLLAKHAAYSVQILEGRIPLGPHHLKIIENHHSFSLLTRDLGLVDISDKTLIKGFESMIVSTMDIIAAMITERPYRSATPIFEALELIKVLVADQYPHEFRLIVSYFKNFFAR
jgi:HD-GYP domain-containing protein (c-di-GMP phosphodiesterase class II)